MENTKPILRVGKIHSSGRATPESVGSHLARTRPTPNADPARTKSNQWLIGEPGMDIRAAIDGVLAKAKIVNIRKDAVLANDILLTVSPEFFRPDHPDRPGVWDENRLKVFKAEAEQMLRKTFGKRIVAAVLHLDEATPHIQALIVPVMKGREGKPGLRLSSKDMFGPEQLSQLQQDWEDRLQPHGVGPRLKGSKARHTTLREYYGALEAFQAEDPRKSLSVAEPPSKRLLEGSEAHKTRTQAWRQAEAKRIREAMRPLAVEAARGRLYDHERRSTTALRASLAQSKAQVAKAAKTIELTKEQISKLRGAPIHEVAEALGYTGEINRRENAIDLVKRVGEFDYDQAVTWLAQRFDVNTAAEAARLVARDEAKAAQKKDFLWTKAEMTKGKLLAEQLDALSAPKYRITIMHEGADGKKYGKNPGKQEDGSEKFFDRNGVLWKIPELIKENVRGGHVYITPIDDKVYHVLVDDLSQQGLKTLKDRGYKPSVVLETSPGNHQAILKVPASAGPKEAVNAWFKDLNRDLGDQKITGLIHPMRAAGFENRKEKHRGSDNRFPFVRVVETVNQFCAKSIELVRFYALPKPAPKPVPRPRFEPDVWKPPTP